MNLYYLTQIIDVIAWNIIFICFAVNVFKYIKGKISKDCDNKKDIDIIISNHKTSPYRLIYIISWK